MLLISGFCLSSCEKELKTYDGKEGIYFLYAVESRFVNGVSTISDFTPMSFGASLPSVTDSVMILPVRTMGTISNVDRSYTLKIADTSTAKEGVHFDFVSKNFSIKAGKRDDTVKVRFKRVKEMRDTSFSLVLVLESNDHFSTTMTSKVVNASTGEKRSFISHRLTVTDKLNKPARWLDAYLGTFSAKKLLLICSQQNISPSYWDNAAIAEISYWGRFTQRYLNDMKAAGTPVMEEDGVTEMIMGPSSQ